MANKPTNSRARRTIADPMTSDEAKAQAARWIVVGREMGLEEGYWGFRVLFYLSVFYIPAHAIGWLIWHVWGFWVEGLEFEASTYWIDWGALWLGLGAGAVASAFFGFPYWRIKTQARRLGYSLPLRSKTETRRTN